jgi:hypothetical protein
VNFEHAGLDQREQAVEIVDGEDFVAFFGDQMQMIGADAGGGMLLEEAFAGSTFRAAQQ